MFRLDKPISCARPVSDFDDISTILTHSSITGSSKAANWQQFVGEDGNVFFVELSRVTSVFLQGRNKETDTSSLCSYCSTRSTQSCTSEDTGYSSDADNQSSHSRQTTGSINKPLSTSSKFAPSVTSLPVFADVEEDDGVSVDVADYDESETKCASKNKSGPGSSCGHTAFKTKSHLCVRHSENLCTCSHRLGGCPSSGDKLTSCIHRTCLGCMEQVECKSQKWIKEVIIRTGGHMWDGQPGAGWLQAVLGIVPGRAHPQSQDDKKENVERSRNQQVVIKGLTPEGPAIRNKELLIGDHISSINGRKITWNNLESMAALLNGTRKVRLVVERTNNQSSSPRDSNTLLLNTASITKFLSHSSSSGHQSGNCHVHLNGMHVLYMSMDGVSSDHADHKEDVLYKFPKQDSILSELRGLYYTLTHLLTDDNAANCTLLALVIGGKVVNICCCKEGKDLLIVAAPADRVLTHQLKTLAKNIQRLLRFLFGSVELAFRSSQNHSPIDDFLGFLITFLSPSFKMGKYIRSRPAMYGYIAYLPLPGDIQMAISNTLTEFESAEFANMSETFYGCRRMFTILGSMVFYKGHALCSHLGQEDTVDIFYYLSHAGLLHLTARHRLHQLLVWHEVFPTRLCHDVTDTNSVFGYSEPYARWFLMVVGMKNLLLATLLEAGGCAAQIEGPCLPDPFYVDQARATTLQLHSRDIIAACERRLCGEGLPPTVKIDKLTSAQGTFTPVIRRFEHLIKVPASISLNLSSNISSLPALSNNMLPAGCNLGNLPAGHEWRKISLESNVSVGNSSSGEQLLKAASGILGLHYPPAEYNLVPITCPPFVVDSDVSIFKLGSGKDNTVLMYCQLNRHEASLVSSAGCFSNDATSSLQRQLLDNFCRCCSTIHADFVKSINTKTGGSECLLGDFEADCTLSSCREQGIMFMITSHDTSDNRKPLSLAYWVVGRKLWYPQLREIFVCFHESTPQNIVEMAFRFSAGNLELA